LLKDGARGGGEVGDHVVEMEEWVGGDFCVGTILVKQVKERN
jgi:hypothetical protein